MSPIFIFVGFCILGAIWTGIWGWVMLSTRRPADYGPIEDRATILRRRLTFVAAGVVLAMFLASIYFLPYAFIRGGVLGAPATKVNVVGQQWAWIMSQNKFQAGVPVEFDVTSKDVNHAFGIYDPRGNLIGQVQAMPGYVNRLIVKFAEPGTYIIRCLELCGTPHFAMQTQITVTA